MRITGALESNSIEKVQRVLDEDIKVNIPSSSISSEANPENNTIEESVEEQDIIQAIEQANKSVIVYDRRLEFSIHERTKQIMVKVIDTVKNEVIREIPAEKTLDMVAKLLEVAGILVDEKI